MAGLLAEPVIDCPDPVRRDRLTARGMTEEGIDDAVRDAGVLRALGVPIVGSTGTVAETAERVAAWVGPGSTARGD